MLPLASVWISGFGRLGKHATRWHWSRDLCDAASCNRLHCLPRRADDASLSLVLLNYHGCSLSHLLLALSTMVEPLYPLFPIASFLGFVLVLIPLPWHLQAWNSGTCFFVLWTSLACLNQFINSVMWANDALNRAPVWCDICKLGSTSASSNVLTCESCPATRIMLGAALGIPASSLCIMRRLHSIAKIQSVSPSHAEVRNNLPVLSGILTRVIETPRSYHRRFHLHSLSDHLHGSRFVTSCPQVS